MPQRQNRATTPDRKAASNGNKSGLTTPNDRPLPLLFGDEKFQSALLEIARSGVSRRPKHDKPRRLVTSGICVAVRAGNEDLLYLNVDHPAIEEIRAVLRDLVGFLAEPVDEHGGAQFDRVSPLGHMQPVPFRIALALAQADKPIDIETLRRRLPDIWPGSVSAATDRLSEHGVIEVGAGAKFALARGVPASYRRLLLRLAEMVDDDRLKPSTASGPRATAFTNGNDGAPRLFGTDAAFRRLVALAVYGPMHYRDLRRITGAYHLHVEGEDEAPFGRGALVRTWNTPDGLAVALDESHPVHPALRRLLLRLAEAYPPAPHVPTLERPDVPPPQAWVGERLALFGSRFPTEVLLTLANRGWTFEAICAGQQTGKRDPSSNKRVLVKKTIRRLEEGGILTGNRPRGPGFGPRLLTIPEGFVAKEELYAVIEAAVTAWTDLGQRVEAEFNALPAKTKEYFRRRGLWADERPLD